MQIDPREIDRLIEASHRRVRTDQRAVACVEAVVLAAIAAFLVASVLSCVLR